MPFEYVQQAWNAYKKNVGAFIGGLFIVLLPALILMGLGMVAVLAPFAVYQGFGALQIIGLLVAAAGWIYMISMLAGYYGMCAEALKGGTRIQTMIDSAKARWMPAVGAGLMSIGIALFAAFPIVLGGAAASAGSVSAIIGMLAGYVAMFILQVLLAFIYPAIVVDGLGAVAAVRRSIGVGIENFMTALVLILIFAILGFFAAITVIGLVVVFLVLVPLEYIAFTAMYLDLRREPRRPARPRRRRK